VARGWWPDPGWDRGGWEARRGWSRRAWAYQDMFPSARQGLFSNVLPAVPVLPERSRLFVMASPCAGHEGGGAGHDGGGPAMTMLQRLRAKMRTAGILSRRATLAQNDVWTAAAEKARSVPIFFRVN